MSNRIQKINALIKQEVGYLIQFDLKDPRLNEMISVVKVDTTGDLNQSKIYVSIFDTPEKQQEAIEILNKASGYVRKFVGKKLKAHHTPEILFLLDDSIEYGVHINKMLHDLNEDHEEKDTDDENES